MTAEEILKSEMLHDNIPIVSKGFDKEWGFVLRAMEEYAQQQCQKQLREELIKFIEYEGEHEFELHVPIESIVDEYLKSKQPNDIPEQDDYDLKDVEQHKIYCKEDFAKEIASLIVQQCQKQLREEDIEAWFYQKGIDTRFAHELYEYLKQKGLPL